MTSMVCYLFEVEALIFAPDVDVRYAKLDTSHICFMRQLFKVVLGAYPSFRFKVA